MYQLISLTIMNEHPWKITPKVTLTTNTCQGRCQMAQQAWEVCCPRAVVPDEEASGDLRLLHISVSQRAVLSISAVMGFTHPSL